MKIHRFILHLLAGFMLMVSLMFSVLAQSNVVAQKQMEAGREIRVQPHVIAAVAKS